MRGHIDASTMRIWIDASSTPDHLIFNADSALRRALEGTFDGYAPTLTKEELIESVVAVCFVAHERRHYDDYYLTNYGNHLANFWSSVRQLSDGLVQRRSETIPIPIWFWHDPLSARLLGLSEPSDTTERASRYCLNYRRLLERDSESGQPFDGMPGSAQLECLAVAFEGAAIDILDSPPLEDQVRERLSAARNAEVFTNRYAWMAFALDVAGVGPSRVSEPIAYSRTWPAFLVASLMGEFSRLTETPVAEWTADLLESVLPSHRLAAILMWCRDRDLRDLHRPDDAWEVVGSACSELFGATPLESMATEIEVTLRKLTPVLYGLRSDPDLNIHPGLRDVIGRTLMRREYLEVLSTDPARLLDPVTSIRQAVLARPDHVFYEKEGFRRIVDGYEGLASPPYAATRNGRSFFVRPIPDEVDRAQLDEDESRSVLERYLVNGGTGREWIGPELDWIRQNVADHFRVYTPFR